MRQKYILAGIALLSLMVLAACGGGASNSMQIGSAVLDTYSAPESYADHRAQQQLIEVDGEMIAYTDHGTGPAVVLLHGVPTSSWMYRKVIPGLQDELRVITIDFLGYGSSGKPDGDETIYGAAAQAGRVQAVLQHLQVREHALLMHDMGGLVAWEMLRLQPETVSHLIVLNTIVSETGFNHPDMAPGAFTRQLVKTYSSPLTSVAVLQGTFDSLGLTGEHTLSEAECFGYVAPMREGSDDALYAFFTQIDDNMFSRLDDRTNTFEGYDGETIVLWGAKDDVLTTDQIPILQERLNVQDENIHIYEDTAHFVAEERPDDVIREVKALVSGG